MWSTWARTRHQRERFCRFGIRLLFVFLFLALRFVHSLSSRAPFLLKMEWKSFVQSNIESLCLSRQHHFAREFHNSWRLYVLQLNKSCIKLCDRLLIVLWFLMFAFILSLYTFSLPSCGYTNKIKWNVRVKKWEKKSEESKFKVHLSSNQYTINSHLFRTIYFSLSTIS